MPSLLDHHAASVIKLLAVGESGTGKSGMLASLATAGYHLWLLDYDNGIDVIYNALKEDKAALSRVTYETLRDTITVTNGTPKPTKMPAKLWPSGKWTSSRTRMC